MNHWVVQRPKRGQQLTHKMVNGYAHHFDINHRLCIQGPLTHKCVVCFVLTGSGSPNPFMELMDGNIAHSGIKPSSQASQNKDLERLRLSSTANQIPNMVPPGPSSSFPHPIYPVPLLSHVPMVRPPPQLHPNVIQRMLAQGIQPQQLGPALVQAG